MSTDAEEDFDVPAARRRVGPLKSHITRIGKSIDNLGEFLASATSPSAGAREDISRLRVKLEVSWARLEDLLISLQTHDDTEAHQSGYGQSLEEYSGRYNDYVRKCLEMAPPAPMPATPSRGAPSIPVGGSSSHTQVKVNTALKPFILKKESTPVEFRLWKEKMLTYYTSSRMDIATLPEQQQYCRACISTQVDALIADKITDATRVCPDVDGIADSSGGDDIMSILEGEYALKYPLFTRRLDFFRYEQRKSQTFSEFSAGLKALANEADLFDMRMDDILKMRYITGTCDVSLRERLLKESDKDLREWDDIGRSFEAATSSLQCLSRDSATAAAVQNRNRGKKKQTGKKGSQDIPPKTANDLKGLCRRCGDSKHNTKDCPREDLTCFTCGKPNHTSRVCMTGGTHERFEKNKQKGRGRSLSRNKRRSPSPSPTSSEQSNCLIAFSGSQSKRTSRPTPRLDIRCRGKRGTPFSFRILPDSGASTTIISMDLVSSNGIPINRDSRVNVRAANGQKLDCQGAATLYIRYGEGKETKVHAYVSADVKDDIMLSWHDMVKLGILHQDFPEPIHVHAVEIDEISPLKAEFADVFGDFSKKPLKPMSGPPMQIRLRKDIAISPKKTLTARPIPIHMREEADELVDKALEYGIIREVTEPTEWVSPGFFVRDPPKGDNTVGNLRMVTDFGDLSMVVERPVHPFPSAMDIINTIAPDSKVFAKLDATKGYFQIPLGEESQLLTTFLLPRGRFCYMKGPMGLNATGDEWNLRSDQAVSGLPGVSKIVDDILVQAPNRQVLFDRIRAVLDRCRQHGITLSEKKFEVGERLPFAGFVVSAAGVHPDPAKVEAIREFPVPSDVTAVRSFLGLANQLGSFLPDLAHVTSPLRGLLRKNVAFVWLPEHQHAFDEARRILTSSQMVHHFDKDLPTELLTDASRTKGLGYALVQKDAMGHTRLIQCGSRSLSDTESRYATIELECLAIAWAVNKCHFHLFGMPHFMVWTDHRPLKGIFRKHLNEIKNVRLQRIRMQLVDYTFDVDYTPGKTHMIADALSRAPIWDPPEDDAMIAMICSLDHMDPALQCLMDDALADEEYQTLIAVFKSNTHIRDLPPAHPARAYQSLWDEIRLQDGLLMYGDRIIIPKTSRKRILDLLHIPHNGIEKTRVAARQLYFWPTMNNDIKLLVEKCEACQQLRPSQVREPLQPTMAEGPMDAISVDLFHYEGDEYLLMVDRFSGWPFTKKLRKTDTGSIIKQLRLWFWDFGYPRIVRSDGGPQFREEFKEFLHGINAKHEDTSAYYAQSNGHAESAVKNVKALIAKYDGLNDECFEALAAWRNSPRADGFSPAQMFFGRRQRGILPAIPAAYVPIDLSEAAAARQRTSRKNKDVYDRRSRPLSDLKVGMEVRIQDPKTRKWDRFGMVTSIRPDGRSYYVLSNGRTLLRNRTFLKPRVIHDDPTSTSECADKPTTLRRSSRIAEKQKSVRFRLPSKED